MRIRWFLLLSFTYLVISTAVWSGVFYAVARGMDVTAPLYIWLLAGFGVSCLWSAGALDPEDED